MQPLTELGHGWQGQTRGAKWVSTPLCQEEGLACVYLPDAEYSHPHKEGPSPPIEGGFIPSIEDNEKTEINKNLKLTSRA